VAQPTDTGGGSGRADASSMGGAGQLFEMELVTRTRIWALGCEAQVDKVAWLKGLRAACERNPGFEFAGRISEGDHADDDDEDGYFTAEEDSGATGWQGALLQQTARVLHQHRLHLRAFFRQIDERASGSVKVEEFKVRRRPLCRRRRRRRCCRCLSNPTTASADIRSI